MGFFSQLGLKLDTIFESDDERFKRESKQKGNDFEKCVINLLLSNNKPDKKYFEIEDWTRDTDKNKTGIEINSNKNPDLIVNYLPKNQQFAVECKFRSYLSFSERFKSDCINWSYPEQIKRYQEFERNRNIPVFVVIGLGESPSKPAYIFSIPLSEAKYPELLPSLLNKFVKESPQRLFWDYKNKKLI